MRCACVVLFFLALAAWPTGASAQGPFDPYGDDEHLYGDSELFESIPEPPSPPSTSVKQERASLYHLLPDTPPQTPQPVAPPQGQPARTYRYVGPHPIHADYGSGWCSTAGPHDHPYPPFDPYLFQATDQGYTFLGDPADFGYAGALYWYGGPHPIASGWGTGWCFIPWPHRHLYPPFGPSFVACGAYSCYVGPYDDWYWYYRPFYLAFYVAWYPRFYLGGTYYQTRVPAPHRPSGSVASGRGGGHSHGGHGPARPGGYYRPLPAHPMPLYQRLPSVNPKAEGPSKAPPYHRLPPSPMMRPAPHPLSHTMPPAPQPLSHTMPPAAHPFYHRLPSPPLKHPSWVERPAPVLRPHVVPRPTVLPKVLPAFRKR